MILALYFSKPITEHCSCNDSKKRDKNDGYVPENGKPDVYKQGRSGAWDWEHRNNFQINPNPLETDGNINNL